MNHFISLSEAVQMTTLYRQEKENILNTANQNQNILPLSESFDRAAFDTILSKEGCTGIRIYYGMDSDLKIHAVIVGTDINNQDMITTEEALVNEEDDEIIERGNRCPDICPPESVLNG